MSIESIINNPWTIAIGAPIIVALVFYLFGKNKSELTQTHYGGGDNVAGDKHVSIIKKFSEIQSIRLWPEHLGGNDVINLDNLANLEYIWTEGESIMLALKVISNTIEKVDAGNSGELKAGSIKLSINPNKMEGVSFSNGRIIDGSNSIIYTFNKRSNQHKIKLQSSEFIVTLNKIKVRNIKGVSSAIEYEFGVSEV